MSVEQAADALGIGRGLAYRMARKRELPVLRMGRVLRVPVEELRMWIATRADATNRTRTGRKQRSRRHR
jgi:excisionase family DNA binding protein